MNKCLILFAAITFTACAPKNIKDFKSKNTENSYQFTVNETYQPVHRKLLDQAKECWSIYLLTAQYVVQNELYPDSKSSMISAEFHSAFGSEIHRLIEIKEIGEKQTEVKTYWHRGDSKKMGDIVKNWLEKNSTYCG